MRRARAITAGGSPARRATWMPYERSVPPGRTLWRKMISSFHSLTATWKFEHARQPLGERGQLVVVGGEQHLGPRPRSCSSSVTAQAMARPSKVEVPRPDLVEEDEAARRRVVQDARRLDHLDQEGALAAREIVLGPDARQDAIDQPDAWPRGRGRRRRSAPGSRAGRPGA